MFTVAWYDVISWAITIISSVLFITEYRKNTNHYMVLQGILRACNQRANFLAAMMQRVDERQIPPEEFKYVLSSEYTNYVALQEHLMGSMKSLQPRKDMPFDVGGFIDSHRPEQEINSKTSQIPEQPEGQEKIRISP
jgi:hypothetical protein